MKDSRVRSSSVAPLPVIGRRRDGRPIFPIAGADGTESGNPVLNRLREERQRQVELMDGILEGVEAEKRDLVDAETSNLKAIRERIGQIDAQIEPLEAFEQARGAHRQGAPRMSSEPTSPREDRDAGRQRLGSVQERAHEYKTPGEFIVDLIRGRGSAEQNLRPDEDAARRVASVMQTREHQTTADTPGLLPQNIIGQIVNDIDGSRPFISSVGALPLAGIPGVTFSRPHVTQHTTTGEQEAEKTELASRQFKVGAIPFQKKTFGGWLNVSRQSIDWTSPAAWNALVADLQMEYGGDTDDWAAGQFAAGVTQSVDLTDPDDIKAWVAALYAAAVKAATASGTKKARALRLPDHMWVSLDQWAAIGTVIDSLRVTQQSTSSPGTSTPTAFAGDIVNMPRTVVPGFPSGTVIIGRKNLYEFYEERIGLLSAVEPKVLGVEVAYGGYAAEGFLDATAFSKVDVGGDPVGEGV